jgi:hypothetical protein
MKKRILLTGLRLLLGGSSLLVLTACGGGGSDSSDDTFDYDLDELQPYVSTSPYASILKDCALAETSDEVCLLSDLPLLIEEGDSLTVDDVMNRLLVSHDWMGLRFRQWLQTMPDDLLQLFAAVTTIVIDAEVRPSFYYGSTSTIYLDAAYFWLTVEEKAVISTDEDYRSAYSNDLNFIRLSRHVFDEQNAWYSYSLTDSSERSLADMRLNAARLLLHELLHANDFFPPSESPYLSQQQTVYDAYLALTDERISTQLIADTPLASELLTDLAQVMFYGETATLEQQQLTALEVGAELASDGANDDYAYSNAREDAAMLFQEAMMKYLFDIDRDVAYTDVPEGDSLSCNDYIVAWGERGRIGDSDVKARAQFVVEEVYLDQDFSLFFQNLSYPSELQIDTGWCDALVLP